MPLPAGSIPAPRDILRKEMIAMIDAKVSFMNQIESGMADTLTVEQMKKLQAVGY